MKRGELEGRSPSKLVRGLGGCRMGVQGEARLGSCAQGRRNCRGEKLFVLLGSNSNPGVHECCEADYGLQNQDFGDP